MQLLTPINITHSDKEISYTDKILLLGSCFSQNMSAKFEQAYFRICTNPFGVLYNPLSIARCVQTLLSDTQAYNLPTINHDSLWHSFLHHSDFSRSARSEFDKVIGRSITDGRKALFDATVLVVTFGTSWVYEYRGQIVGNCHKLPAQQFFRRRLTTDEIVDCWHQLISLNQLKEKHFIFTISPIRHIKDGLHENQISKAILLLAIEQLAAKHPNVSYFPSYEIMVDELRDYRFYAQDMLHPSSVAIDYIWERFTKTYFSTKTCSEMQPLQQLFRRRQHRPLHTDTEQYQLFLQQTEQMADKLRHEYPWIPIN